MAGTGVGSLVERSKGGVVVFVERGGLVEPGQCRRHPLGSLAVIAIDDQPVGLRSNSLVQVPISTAAAAFSAKLVNARQLPGLGVDAAWRASTAPDPGRTGSGRVHDAHLVSGPMNTHSHDFAGPPPPEGRRPAKTAVWGEEKVEAEELGRDYPYPAPAPIETGRSARRDAGRSIAAVSCPA